MSIEALVTAVPPPAAPFASFAGPWEPIEADLGVSLPPDYKEFVRLYGHGYFLEFLSVNVPVAANRYVHLTFSALMICNAHRTVDYVPYPLWPEPGGLLPFGSTDNGDYLCWLTLGSPEDWGVVIWGRAFEYFEKFDCDMTSFLAGLATGQILPKEFPEDCCLASIRSSRNRPLRRAPARRVGGSHSKCRFNTEVGGERGRHFDTNNGLRLPTNTLVFIENGQSNGHRAPLTTTYHHRIFGGLIGGWTMPRKANELQPLQVAARTEPGLHAVGGVAGLCLQVEPTGGRSWVLRVMIAGKRREMGLGGYPDVKLADARRLAREAREAISKGRDPVEERRAAKAKLLADAGRHLTFERACRDYLAAHEPGWKHPAHVQAWKHTLLTIACNGTDCGDAGNAVGLGKLTVGDVETTHALNLLRPLWETKTETAQRTRQRCEAVLNAAKAAGAIRAPGWHNPFRWKGHLDALLAKPRKLAPIKHQRALPAADAAAFMVALRERSGSAARALEMLILTASRSNEVRGARWSEVDLGGKVWTVPASRMKGGREHRVPLSDAAMSLLNALPCIAGDDLLFPGPSGKPLSDVAVSKLCGQLSGSQCVPHGWRSTFRDWAGDVTSYPREVAEAALAHVVGGVEGAYRRGDAVERRRPLMADWATFLAKPPELKGADEGGNVRDLHARRG